MVERMIRLAHKEANGRLKLKVEGRTRRRIDPGIRGHLSEEPEENRVKRLSLLVFRTDRF